MPSPTDMSKRPYEKTKRVDRLWFFIQTTRENLRLNRISPVGIQHAQNGLVLAEAELRSLCAELKLDAEDLLNGPGLYPQ